MNADEPAVNAATGPAPAGVTPGLAVLSVTLLRPPLPGAPSFTTVWGEASCGEVGGAYHQTGRAAYPMTHASAYAGFPPVACPPCPLSGVGVVSWWLCYLSVSAAYMAPPVSALLEPLNDGAVRAALERHLDAWGPALVLDPASVAHRAVVRLLDAGNLLGLYGGFLWPGMPMEGATLGPPTPPATGVTVVVQPYL